jgi:tRNA(Ile)-lysidine synthase
VRPLLECSRQELRTYLGEQRASWVDDESNLDTRIPRNRVRAELVPLLEKAFNPAIVETLAREADLSRETWQWLDGLADALLTAAAPSRGNAGVRPQTSGVGGESLELNVALLKGAPPPVVRFAMWKAMTRVAAGRAVSSAQVAAALGLLGMDRGSIDGPGQRLERIGERLVLTGREPRNLGNLGNLENPGNLENRSNLFEYPLSIPGEARLGEGIGVLSAESLGPRSDLPEGAAATGRGPAAWVRADACTPPLVVRNRRPGDRFRPIGVGGQKKVQDYFVDRKVARSSRDHVPMVVDGRGRIVWVAGFGIDEAFRVTDVSQSVLLLRLRQV